MTGAARERLVGAGLGALAGALPVAALWGYTVDDALISARVAANIARGLGHRMNAGGAVVDAVTPLGYAWLLAPFAQGGVLAALGAARWLGAAAVVLAMAWLGARIASDGTRRCRFLPLIALALSAPLGAWASSGMETGLVTALATMALTRSRWGALAAGSAAAWRPELLPWALVLAAGSAWARRRQPGEVIAGMCLALAPVLAVGLARTLLFGSPTPLAAIAKPSDFAHGVAYALQALVYAGLPVLVLAPGALRVLPGHERAVLAASAAHLLALVAAGGDWMALFRLIVPVLPGWALVAGAIAERATLGPTLGRLAVALGLSSVLWVTHARAARGVLAHKRVLIDRARPLLAGAERVAAVDAGWVGAATDADVVDLAGVTDPTVARLAGGHTTKRIQEGFLRARGVDAVVLLLADGIPAEPWTESRFAYGVEPRIARQAEELGLAPAGTVPLGGTAESYLVLRLKSGAP